VLNLHGLTFVDSAGLGFLVLCSQQFKELDRRITWIEPQGFVGDLINNLQLHNLIAICATEQDALA
jgi:anti-anti-sigma factor